MLCDGYRLSMLCDSYRLSMLCDGYRLSMLCDGYRMSMLCVCFSAPTLLDMQFQMCQSMNTGPGDWGEGGGLSGGGEDRATLGECNSISALAQCFGLAGQGTSFISSAVEPVWRGWQMGIETENRRCS